jgi:predicted ester cyclase
MSEQNKAVVLRIIEDYWNQKNPALAGELFAAECSWHVPGGELPRGLPGASQLYEPHATAFPDFHLTIKDTVVEGDRLAVSYSFTGTNKGPLGVVSPSGKRVTVSGIAIFHLAGGKVTVARLVWDTLSLQQQIGALPMATGRGAS